MDRRYYVAHLKEGGCELNRVLDFDHQCTFIRFTDKHSNIFVFKTDIDGKILAFIPRDNVLAIETREEYE